ncbi:FtsK/SpoIIIE domain-containing protein [Candidatus Saccharibacteria bacterium]|nr:FtsK/SpoIIIE domain-containing protein [Candidatus Saccharibacteria bacterium]
MSKKKRGSKKAKSTRSVKEAPKEAVQENTLGRQVIALLLIAIALVLGAANFFATGAVFGGMARLGQALIGPVAWFIVPVLLLYVGVSIFRADPRQRRMVSGSMLVIFFLAGFFGALSGANEDLGGVIGKWLAQIFIDSQWFTPTVMAILYIVLIIVTLMIMLQQGPKEIAEKLKKAPKTERMAEEEVRVEGIGKPEKTKPPKAGLFGRNKKGVPPVEPVVVAPPTNALVAMADPNWKLPELDLLDNKSSRPDAGNIINNKEIIKNTFAQFGIDVEMGHHQVGPRVTQYTLTPPNGVSLSKIVALDKELSLNLAIDKVRIEAPISGTSLVGVEVPNRVSEGVGLRATLGSPEWAEATSPLSFVLGKGISGNTVVANLAKMPHLLIAGTTGSGKSVMTNGLITSLLFRNTPSELRMIIIDPKQVEMSQYNDIKHLLCPVITQTVEAVSALAWAGKEMERRYTLMSEARVKNIGDYNLKMLNLAKKEQKKAEAAAKKDKSASLDEVELEIKDKHAEGEQDKGRDESITEAYEKLPYLVVVIDEMADLMMQAGKQLEALIVRIAQKGRASGIHLILATQRPEVKVVTGLIKANVPGRIAFAVSNQTDSRVMIDQAGAEKLLGSGDALLLTTEMMGKPKRVQGAYVSDAEVERVTEFLRKQAQPDYNEEVLKQEVAQPGKNGADNSMAPNTGDLVRDAAALVIENSQNATISKFGRKFRIGYNKAADLMEELEERGVVAPSDGSNRPRKVLINSLEEMT